MLVRDVMVAPVITVEPSASVQEVAKLFLEKQISAVPVLDGKGKLVGIVSEGDLLHRVEAGTERHRSWWLRALVHDQVLADEYIKSHSRKVSDVMTRDVITASPDMPLHEVAALMEKNAIRRLPILENGQLVGIVSRANLLQAVASARQLLDVAPTDKAIRDRILTSLKREAWAHTGLLNVTVSNGIVDLWGLAESETERKAIKVAAESTPGVTAVHDNMVVYRSAGWA
jgi:CBS domain-containing protein